MDGPVLESNQETLRQMHQHYNGITPHEDTRGTINNEEGAIYRSK